MAAEVLAQDLNQRYFQYKAIANCCGNTSAASPLDALSSESGIK